MKSQLARLQRKVEELCQNRQLEYDEDTEAFQRPATELLSQTTSPLNNLPAMNTSGSTLDSRLISPEAPRSPQYYFAIFQTTDTFVAKATSPSSPSSIATSSQIRTLRKLGKGRDTPQPQRVSPRITKIVQLPESSILWSRVEAFLQEFGCFWPFLRGENVREKLSVAIGSTMRGSHPNQIIVTATNCKMIAILFNMLAYADLMDEVFATADISPGSQSYCQGLSLMESFGMLHDNDLETMIYYTIAASFFLAAEKLHTALQSASQAFHIARCLELNNQKRWPENTEAEIACRQSLWWTLYFLDKRITQKIGISYSVRENECGVREFDDDGTGESLRDHHEMLQSMVNYSHLWAYIWDGFFSPRASVKQIDFDEVELTDTKIMLAYRRLPDSLLWDYRKALEYMKGDNETQIRRRLLVFLVRFHKIQLKIAVVCIHRVLTLQPQRFTFLRLSIRHSHLRSEKHERQRRESCISLCKAMVDAVQSYTDSFGSHKPSGYFLTSALVESLYWIEIERRQETPVAEACHLDSIKETARRLLHDLSLSIGAASRAYQSLSDVLSNNVWEELLQDPENLPDFSELFIDEMHLPDNTSQVRMESGTPESTYSRLFSKSMPAWIAENGLNDLGDFDWEILMEPLPLTQTQNER
ncbi:hypothetical protein PENSUB_11289 [Penicillium subrubescens]|uniref:Xylanolytic transcriptional activator regulatory domain-containing protein n=2 Tax=Penicillium subrubescens TaxID=1316194 RepID=A0A1Q5T4Q9_9EURO|nr:hypothetical protein PENSUB_11289 [Penicillium subrubescens]